MNRQEVSLDGNFLESFKAKHQTSYTNPRPYPKSLSPGRGTSEKQSCEEYFPGFS